MKQILDKIIHVVTDVQHELITSEDALIFFKGYIQALVDAKMIDDIEKRYYIHFVQSLLIHVSLHKK